MSVGQLLMAVGVCAWVAGVLWAHGGAVQAKDISDDVLIAAIKKVRWGEDDVGAPGYSMLSNIQDALPMFPPKVVLAKLKSFSRRGFFDDSGLPHCTCGCRGDFKLKEEYT